MKKFWQWLTGSVIKEVGEVLDNLTTTKEEKLEAQRLITEILEKADKEAQEQVTARWESDMKSDSFLSKNIPLILGSSYINSYLKKLGFWLADDIFDLSPQDTRVGILNQYKKNLDVIHNMTLNEIHEYYHKNINNIDRNFEMMKQAKFYYNTSNYKSLKRRLIDKTTI